MQTYKRILAISVLLFATSGYAATVTMTAKYGKTGGLAGNLNHVNDMVNGRNICPAANTNANGTPGCDMSNDPGLNDNGTPNDPSDDYYTGDMIVRTNDSFEAIAAYAWIGNAGGNEEQVTITGTLPAGTGFIWDGVPGSCDQGSSSLSSDKKTITCVRKDFDTNDVGSFAEDMAFAVKVEGDAQNGVQPGYVSFTIDTPNNVGAPVTATTQTSNPVDQDKIIVTASPRWNMDKHSGAGYYTTQYGQTNPNTGETGWILWYNFTIEVDEVPGEVDDPINPSLGNEAMQGGNDATVTFTDDLSNISPNAVLATWSSNGCDMTHTNSDEPYPYLVSSYPDRSIPVPNGTMAVTCTQSGTSVAVTVDHVDATLTNAPIRTRTGALLPVNRKIAAIGTLRIFVPLSDVENGADGISGTADDGQLATTNYITNFTPKGISGTDNFNGAEESEKDNKYNLTLYAARGSWSKSYRKGWSDRPDQIAQWGGGSWALPPTDAAVVMGGDGTATPGTRWGTYNVLSNTGGTDLTDAAVCDVIDIETFEMEILNPNADDPATALDDTKHAVDIDYGSTETIPNLNVEYAIGYVGTWPPDPTQPAGDAVARECNNTSITWYPDYVTAKAAADAAGTGVSKVRLTAPVLAPSRYMALRIKHKARSTFLSTGNPIPSKTLLVNYGTYKNNLTGGNYFANSPYQPNDADTPHLGGWHGDRLILQRAKVRIVKEMAPTAVSPGSEVAVRLAPSFTVDGPTPENSNVVIADLLPKGLAYKSGSTIGSWGAGSTPYGEPTVISPATDADCNLYAATLVADGKPCGTLNGGTGDESIVYWDLGTQTTGTVYGDINFTAIVTVDAPQGVLANYAQIESPADQSAPSKRVANANVNNTVPSSLLSVKSVLTPLHEINKGSLLNWMEFEIGVRNGSSNPLTELDIIDILPFNGDGTMGSFTFTPSAGTTVNRNRVPATDYHGTFQFDSMSFNENGSECDAANISYWYTNAAGPLDISPVHSSNAIPAGSANWCQGTATGPNASCGFTNADVTAVRVRGVDMTASGTCYLNVKFATQNNFDQDIYSNTAGAKANGVTNAVLTNTVSARVFASAIGDTVWYDKDHDGVQDGGTEEPGLANVTVNLYDNGGNLIATTQTDGNGHYTFINLVSGDYVVEVVPPAGYTVTQQGAGGNSALDSDIDPNTNKTAPITLGQDENNIDIDAGLSTPVVSGHIFDDGNGDGNINGTGIGAASGTQLYVHLIDAAGNVVGSSIVAADGSYEFDGEDGVRTNSNYTVELSTVPGTIGQPAPGASLPAGWNNADGEQPSNALNGNDGTPDGILSVHVGTVDMPNNDFGINHAPVADDKTEPSRVNPGGTNTVTVPTLTGNDDESSTLIYTITTLPTNATLYYNSTVISTPNFVVADPSLLTVDPDNGAQTVIFNYTTTDAANTTSTPATVTMPFTDLIISGTVYDDGNGDGNINGTGIGIASGTQLHANLLDASGNVVATTPIANNGMYSFGTADGVTSNTGYTVQLSTTAGTVGQPAPGASLPAGWNNADGEQPSNAQNGNDGSPDGTLNVSLGTTSLPNNDFGINHAPVADDKTEPSQANPAGNNTVPVPTLTGNDDESSTLIFTITTLPNNATLHYNGTAITAPNFIVANPSLLTVDPDDGDQTVIFNYTTTDEAGVVSPVATVTMPFTNLVISGTVYDDGNGDGNVNGTPTDNAGGTMLYANLVDAAGNIVATTLIASDGTYSFATADGVSPNTAYTIELSTVAGTIGQPAPGSSLPADWNNADGENINSAGTGTDGSPDGIVAVNVGTSNIAQIDFGINQAPVATDMNVTVHSNPPGNIQYPVPQLNITDTEDGVPTTVTITTVPGNGTLYYNGTPVTAGQVITNFDPSLLSIDPDDGNQDIIFTYTTTDAAGVTSSPATVLMPFLADMHVGDLVWNDTNGNGVQDPGEAGEANVTVNLYDSTGTLVATMDTNASGEYEFTLTQPGNYYIEFDNSHYYTVQDNGADNTDSDANPITGQTTLFTLNYGDNNLTIDAGIAPVAHIGDYFWVDNNQNGIQDPGESPVAGATVELFDANGNPITDVNGNHSVMTDQNGKYGFDVPPGIYQLRFTLPSSGYEGYVFTNANSGNDAQDSDVGGNGFTQTISVQAGQNILTLDAGINCGCDNAPIQSNGGDALSLMGMVATLLAMLMTGLYFVRKETQYEA